MNMTRNWVFGMISNFKGKSKLSSQKITENIHAVRCGYVNFFIYTENETCICIDTGFDSGHIKRELGKLGINPVNISMVLLTHSDYDHFGGIKVFPNAEVCLSKNEKEMIMKGKKRPFGISKKSQILNEMKLLNDEDILKINSTVVRCILTPGHTCGSMSYLVNGKYLFAGDTCRIINNKIMPLTRLINMDTERQNISIERLRTVANIEMTFTGHYGYKYGF